MKTAITSHTLPTQRQDEVSTEHLPANVMQYWADKAAQKEKEMEDAPEDVKAAYQAQIAAMEEMSMEELTAKVMNILEARAARRKEQAAAAERIVELKAEMHRRAIDVLNACTLSKGHSGQNEHDLEKGTKPHGNFD